MCCDPDHRFTCELALAHPWISGNTARTKDIHGSVASRLQKSLARQKWKKAYNATAAIRQLQMLRLNSTARPSTSARWKSADIIYSIIHPIHPFHISLLSLFTVIKASYSPSAWCLKSKRICRRLENKLNHRSALNPIASCNWPCKSKKSTTWLNSLSVFLRFAKNETFLNISLNEKCTDNCDYLINWWSQFFP